MAIPVLKLNLAPPSNLWRLNHAVLSWTALALGGALLAGSLGLTWTAYRSAALTGKLAGNLATKTRATAESQAKVMAELRAVDVAKELPRWRLAERIYTERSLPWSRLTAELERSLVKDVRIKSIQRNRGNDQKVQLKLKGEARSREAEALFVEALQKNAFFEQVILEREGERQGGGVEFDYTLAASSTPPPYQPLPKLAAAAPAKPGAKPGPAGAPAAAPVTGPVPTPRAGVAVPAPTRPPAGLPGAPFGSRPGVAVPLPARPQPAAEPPPDPGAPPLNRMLPPDGSLPLGRRPVRRRAPSNEQEDQP